MSFICGLSTIATLIEPPFAPPCAAVLELFEPPPPPQPAATAPTTASRATADQRRRPTLMCSSPLLQSGGHVLRHQLPLIGCFMWVVKLNRRLNPDSTTLAAWVGLCLDEINGSVHSHHPGAGPPPGDRAARGSRAPVRPPAARAAHRPHRRGRLPSRPPGSLRPRAGVAGRRLGHRRARTARAGRQDGRRLGRP